MTTLFGGEYGGGAVLSQHGRRKWNAHIETALLTALRVEYTHDCGFESFGSVSECFFGTNKTLPDTRLAKDKPLVVSNAPTTKIDIHNHHHYLLHTYVSNMTAEMQSVSISTF